MAKEVDVRQDQMRAGENRWRRFLPLLLLALLLALFFLFRLDRYLSFEALRAHRAALITLVAERAHLIALVYVLIYAALVAASAPVGVIMTLAGGLLFGPLWGTVLSIAGAGLGAVAIFLAARTALGGRLRPQGGAALRRLEAGLRRDAFNYLLVLRLLPVAPFWLVNLLPAFLGVPLRTYVLATAIGIVPGAAVYAGLGAGIGATIDRGEEPDLGIIFEPRILLPLIGLAVLALLPIAWKRWRRKEKVP